jgi:hypothetical protein
MSPGVKPAPKPRPDGRASSSHAGAEQACAYVIAKVRASSGRLFDQGARVPALASTSSSPAVRFIAERRLHRVSTAVARALLAWADGFPVELLTEVPPAAAVLALQAEGRRCVSLLSDGTPTHPHADELAFTIHDLCHLDKFIDPEHHRGQLGFFACLHRAARRRAWAEFESNFDPAFICDWHHVAADMNGSAVFLFAALKMKLKMGVRRRVAAAEGRRPDQGGGLTTNEARAYGVFLEDLLELLGLRGDIAEAARRTSTRRDDPIAALTLLRHFEEVGQGVVRAPHSDSEPSARWTTGAGERDRLLSTLSKGLLVTKHAAPLK